MKDHATPNSQSGAFPSMQNDSNSSVSHEPLQGELNIVQDVRLRNESVSQSRSRAPVRTARDSWRLKGASGLKTGEDSASRYKGADSDLSASLPQRRSLGDKKVGKKDLPSSEKQVEDSGLQGMEFEKQMSTLEQIKKSQDRKDEKSSDYRSGKTIFSDITVSEGQEGLRSIPIAPAEQVQRVRQLKGNQELNDELRMKADELEKLLAEHKLRVPGDLSTSICRSKASGVQVKKGAKLLYRKPAADIACGQTESAGISSNVVNFDACPLMKMVDSQDDDLKKNSSDLGILDDYRGKLYNKYAQIRDAKLSKEWASKREEKEAKLKAMQDKLERSRAEMKATFSGTVDRQDSLFNTRQDAERFRSFNSQSTTTQPLDFVRSEGDDDLSEFSEQIPFGPTRSFCETPLEDDACRSTPSRKLLPGRNLSSSIPRSFGRPVIRSAVKASNSTSGGQRMQFENPLAQSVPKFSDFRKENTKPLSGFKTTVCPKLKSNARSKSSTEEASLLVRDEKPRLSQSLRKTSTNPSEFVDLHLNSEGIVSTPLDCDEEHTEKIPNYGFTENMEAKASLRNGNEIGSDSGPKIAKMKASTSSDAMSNEKESDKFIFKPEDLMDVVEVEEEEGLKATATEVHKLTLGQESDKLVNFGSKNGEALGSFSLANPSLVPYLPAAMPSTSQPVALIHDSPGETLMSWNSHMSNPFSFPNETCDVNASVDSPTGSPSSLNSHSLNQTEADVGRVRKKWGSAEKPTLLANPPHNQSIRDVTKGFKRLLKFGRKAHGTESLVDWIFATTSEGDDDTADGRDLANQPSEDLGKLRMGFSRGHPYDCFKESQFFSEQVQALNSSIPMPPANFKLGEGHFSGTSIKAPRSFFSLPSFRSKGGDSKPR